MLNWSWVVFTAFVLAVAGAAYIRLRWRRSPRAYRAMMGLAVCYFVAGAMAGAWVLHLATPKSVEVTSINSNLPTPSAAVGAPFAPASAIYLPNRYTGKVVSVTDGDTIDVALAPNGMVRAVRLQGIDAPEHGQAFGSQSTQHLSKMLWGKTVRLDCENERSYGRLICKVILPNGEDADLDQVKAGMAWHYKQYEDEQSPADRTAYAAAECAAMKAKIGLWSDPHPVQPQDFRHGTESPLLLDANGCRTGSEPTSGPVLGDASSHIFEWPGCPYYSAISSDNRVPFPSPQAAEQAGYRPAHNCP